MNNRVVSAANRFGLGARGDELASIGNDPRGWLLGQLAGAPPMADMVEAVPDSLEYLERYATVRKMNGERLRARREAIANGMTREKQRREGPSDAGRLRQLKALDLRWRQRTAVETRHGFAERIVRFWSNHFAISIDKGVATLFGAAMEREAIRPNAFGSFADLLVAVEQHPGMLLYLDNVKSVGEASTHAMAIARRSTPDKRRPGLNENLAREILELHTLGAGSGYTQHDVSEFARAITGWTVPGRGRGQARIQPERPDSAFLFSAQAHEPGTRMVLGKTYPEPGRAQGEAVLGDLALHPATARHLARKLATHFVADQPPAVLIDRMARAYLDGGGQLVPLYRAMVEHDAAWSPGARKFKTPDDFLVSAMRACGLDGDRDVAVALDIQDRLGQPLFEPRSPAGFGDTAADWDEPDALYKRIQAAQALAERFPAGRRAMSPLAIAGAALGASLDTETATALRRAESVRQGVALLLASPAFQWRA